MRQQSPSNSLPDFAECRPIQSHQPVTADLTSMETAHSAAPDSRPFREVALTSLRIATSLDSHSQERATSCKVPPVYQSVVFAQLHGRSQPSRPPEVFGVILGPMSSYVFESAQYPREGVHRGAVASITPVKECCLPKARAYATSVVTHRSY